MYASMMNMSIGHGLVVLQKCGLNLVLMSSIIIGMSAIKCRVAICETEVDFGHINGKQNVYVVSLLTA